MYSNFREALRWAQKTGVAIGAFNTHNLEMVPAIIRAAGDLASPVIVQTSVGTADYVGHSVLVAVCRQLAEDCAVDVVLHLDHATKFTDIKNAIDLGYSSVMFDGSALPYEENLLKTKQVVTYARERNVSVEAELGTIGGTEEGLTVAENDVVYTDPELAASFVAETGIDALAVAIGTNHGQFRSKTQLNFDVLRAIREKVDIPLVVHGGTGVSDADIEKVITLGITKFNVGTELLVGWTRAAQEALGASEVNRSLRHNMIPANDAVYNAVSKKTKQFLKRA